MDLRIVNTCNNDCLYCLEQEYRTREKFIDKNIIFEEIKKTGDKNILNFYGGNPLLHPDLLEIISFGKNNSYRNISLLSNTFGLNDDFLKDLKNAGLTQFGIYFNSFKNHEIIVNNGIGLKILLKNLSLIKSNNFDFKIIVHINFQNIKTLYKDILFLVKTYGKTNFEFINYFPFDRPYDKYQKLLEYDILENREEINNLFLVIKKLGINARFVKFEKEFFGKFIEFYDFKTGILDQIGIEDIERLKDENPFCLAENRCPNCFIKDNCKFYEKV